MAEIRIDNTGFTGALCLATVAQEKPAANTGASEANEQLEDLRSLQQQDFLSR